MLNKFLSQSDIARNLFRIFIILFLLGALLEVLSYTVGLPGIYETLEAILSLLTSGLLLHDISVSLSRWFIGVSLGLLIGISLGIMTGSNRIASLLFEDVFVFFRAIPFIALLPLILYVFGISEVGKIVLLAWVATTVSWVIIHEATRNLPRQIIWKMQTLNISVYKKFFSVILPSIRNQIFTAIRTSLSITLIVVVVAEMGGVYERTTGRWWSEGLGYRIFRSYDIGDLNSMFASIIILAITGLFIDILFSFVWNSLARVREKLLVKKTKSKVAKITPVASIINTKTETNRKVVIENLKAGYGRKPIISNLSFQIKSNKTLAIVGTSGSGKTTLLRAIGGFDAGEFFYSGNRFFKKNIVIEPRDVGIVFHEVQILDHMTVWDNVILGIKNPGENDLGRIKHMLEQFGLLAFSYKLASHLSEGQKQRLAFASALANIPKLLLLDEPFAALDAITRRKMQNFYWKNIKGLTTSILVTHDIEEALLIADEVRVGVKKDSPTFSGNSFSRPVEMEYSQEFIDKKKKIINALDKTN